MLLWIQFVKIFLQIAGNDAWFWIPFRISYWNWSAPFRDYCWDSSTFDAIIIGIVKLIVREIHLKIN